MSKIDVVIVLVLCVLIINIHAYAKDRIIVTSDDDIIVCTTDENGVTVCL